MRTSNVNVKCLYELQFKYVGEIKSNRFCLIAWIWLMLLLFLFIARSDFSADFSSHRFVLVHFMTLLSFPCRDHSQTHVYPIGNKLLAFLWPRREDIRSLVHKYIAYQYLLGEYWFDSCDYYWTNSTECREEEKKEMRSRIALSASRSTRRSLWKSSKPKPFHANAFCIENSIFNIFFSLFIERRKKHVRNFLCFHINLICFVQIDNVWFAHTMSTFVAQK